LPVTRPLRSMNLDRPLSTAVPACRRE
jgi:hypothetical protein